MIARGVNLWRTQEPETFPLCERIQDMNTKNLGALVGLLALFSPLTLRLSAAPLGTAFTYQGRLTDVGQPATGSYDMECKLFDDATAGTQLGAVIKSAVPVTNGLFVVELDFSTGLFTGEARWLQIGVRTNGSAGLFATLSPRQPLTPAPYAFYAPSAGAAASAITAITASNVAPGSVLGTGIANGQVVRSINGQTDAVLLPTNFWSLGGNAGVSPAQAFLGTLDHQPVELWVNNWRAMRWEPGGSGPSPNLLGGYSENMASNGVIGATISGGGGRTFLFLNGPNRVGQNFATVGGGRGNTAGGSLSVVAGGDNNVAAGDGAAVLGGAYNQAAGLGALGGGSNNTANAYGFVGGGHDNTAGYASAIAGGESNIIQTASSTIGGGLYNLIEGVGNADASVIGGGWRNKIGSDNAYGANWSTVGGGQHNTNHAASATIAGGSLNRILDGADLAFLGGGGGNKVRDNSSGSVLVGGRLNSVGDRSTNATLCGGLSNAIAVASGSFLGGGVANSILGNAACATIGGGKQNTISAAGSVVIPVYANNSTIGGGAQNMVMATTESTIGGGSGNMVYLNGHYATIGGGFSNTNKAMYGTIPGGLNNLAEGFYSFAAGTRAQALHNGAFVWSDASSLFTPFASTVENQFAVRAHGGVVFDTPALGIGTTSPDYSLDVQAAQGIGRFVSTANVPGGSVIELRNNTSGSTSLGAINFNDANATYPGQIAYQSSGAMTFRVANTDSMMLLNSSGLYVKGTFVSASDRNEKENFKPVSPKEVLARVAKLPVARWTYKLDPGTEHLGPMAQDFYAAFGVGTDDRHIATVDADGVALSAIQGLNQKLEERLAAQSAELKSRDAQLQSQQEQITRLLGRLESLEEKLRSH
jgi:trimeric autotransporter adhesin